ncbi:unnamed protein product [Malus baccata var. baccata]
MAKGREAPDVENQGEGLGIRDEHGKFLPVWSVICAPIKGIRDEQGKFLPVWSMIFVMSFVFAVTLDPLFFYILIIDQHKKCLQMDKTLSTTVLVLRSLTDIIFIVHFIYKIYDTFKVQKNKQLANEAANTPRIVTSNTLEFVASSTLQTEGNLDRKSKRILSWSSLSIVNDFLALLPIPQLLIVVAFYKMRGAHVEHKKVLNVFLLGQYLPRIYQIHQSSKELRENGGAWVRGLFNFFLYILASHTSCWYSACNHSPDRDECMNTFYCGRQPTTSRYTKFLNESCSLDTPDGASAPFNFGIFLDSLKNRNTEHISFGKKFLYSFWWGLRNIRSKTDNSDEEVNKLKDMNEKVLTLMCDYLKPVTYIENSFVFRMGDPLDCMLFIVEGTMWTYASSDHSQAGSRTLSMDIEPLGKGQFYGEELLDWASDTFTELPVSSKYVKSQTKVEAFVLMAKDLETVISRYKKYWDLVYSKNREEVALSTVRRFRTKAQQRPSSSPPRIADTNGESLPSTAGK